MVWRISASVVCKVRVAGRCELVARHRRGGSGGVPTAPGWGVATSPQRPATLTLQTTLALIRQTIGTLNAA